jgi:hypothetical protein
MKPNKKTEAEFLQKLWAVENYIASAAEDVKTYTFSGPTIEAAWELVYGWGGGDQWLETRVFNVAERVSEQYHEWALFRDDEPGDEGD